MLLPLLRSTLFPYTTLFRSLGGKAESEFEAEGEAAIATDGLSRSNLVGLGPRGHAGAGGNGAVTTPAPGGRLRRSGRRESDRKSTRLNSSHTVISYAVFCLK